MITILSRRREGLFFRLGDSAREIAATWLLLVFVVAVGLSILAIHRYSVVDCPSAAAMPGTHHRLAVDHEWDEPACSIGPCDHSRAAHEIDPDSMQAAQSDGDATPVYSGSSTPVSGRANSRDEDERLC